MAFQRALKLDRHERGHDFDECSSGSRDWMGNFAALIRQSAVEGPDHVLARAQFRERNQMMV